MPGPARSAAAPPDGDVQDPPPTGPPPDPDGRADPVPPEPRNEVLLVGRLAAPAEERELPSGDVLALFRLVVARPEGRVDTLDCAAARAALRRRLRPLPGGTHLQVEGRLRRRFWRSPAGPASRYEVDVDAVTVLLRPPAPPGGRGRARGAAAAARPAASG